MTLILVSMDSARHFNSQFEHLASFSITPLWPLNNVVDLLQFLSQLNLIKFAQKHQELAALYEDYKASPHSLEIREKFKLFLTQISFPNQEIRIHLIGHEFLKGYQDDFILQLLTFLASHKIKITITAFADEALLQCPTAREQFHQDSISFPYPFLKLIDYVLNDKDESIILLGQVKFYCIRKIAFQLNVVYRDANQLELATTIDQINTVFSIKLKNQETMNNIISLMKSEVKTCPTKINNYSIKYYRGDENQEKSILVSDDKPLSIRAFDPVKIAKEFTLNKLAGRRLGIYTALFASLGLLLGFSLGTVLVATGTFAPFGIGLLSLTIAVGIVALGFTAISAALGIAVAKMTEAPFIDTRKSKAPIKEAANQHIAGFLPMKKRYPVEVEVPNHSPITPLNTDPVQQDDAPTLSLR